MRVDETYWGNTHQSKIGKLVGTKQGGHQKEKIVSMVERGGNVRCFHVENVSPSTLKEVWKRTSTETLKFTQTEVAPLV